MPNNTQIYIIIAPCRPRLRQIEPKCAPLDGVLAAGRGVVAGLWRRRAMAGEAGKTDLRLTYIVCRTMLSGNDPKLSRQADEGICRRQARQGVRGLSPPGGKAARYSRRGNQSCRPSGAAIECAGEHERLPQRPLQHPP